MDARHLLSRLVELSGGPAERGFVLALDCEGLERVPDRLSTNQATYQVYRPSGELELRRILWRAAGAPFIAILKEELARRLPLDLLRRARMQRVLSLTPNDVLEAILGARVVGAEAPHLQALAMEHLERLGLALSQRTLPTVVDRKLLSELLVDVSVGERVRTQPAAELLAQWLREPPRYPEALTQLISEVLAALHGDEGRILAWALAQRGTRTLLHGVRQDPTRTTTFELFQALGFPVAESGLEAEHALTSRGLAFAPIDVLHPKLAALLANRWRIGVRSTPHTVVKLLQPVTGPQTRVVALTHGDYIERMAAHLASQSGARGVVFRGCEGEPVLHPRRTVPVQIFRNGETLMREWPGVAAHDLPETCDIATTVAYIGSVISGQRALPAWIDWLAREVHAAAHEQASPAG